MHVLKVDLGNEGYEVGVGIGILGELGNRVKATEIFIVTDPTVEKLYGKVIRKLFKGRNFRILIVPAGEKNKSLKSASNLYDQLVKYSAHRDCVIIALGGGVIGDLAGFVASTYMRGVDCIQVPTTLLAQVDASIGGKTGVNHPKGKNLIGAFSQPKLVFADVETLTTLPDRELRTGLAEVVKYGVIADADFFNFVETNAHHLNTKAFAEPDTRRAALKVWETIVVESAKIKVKVVEKDEREGHLRMILNFGHTVGHAIETQTNYRSFNHGEAVAVGMLAAMKISREIGLVGNEPEQRLTTLLSCLGLPVELKGLSCSALLKAMLIDKKVKTGKIRFVLPDKIGSVVIRDDISSEVIGKVLKVLGCC